MPPRLCGEACLRALDACHCVTSLLSCVQVACKHLLLHLELKHLKGDALDAVAVVCFRLAGTWTTLFGREVWGNRFSKRCSGVQ